jgi:phosphoribosylaminoimidazole-succinocarboxamide synthase
LYCSVAQVLPEAPRELVEELSRRYVYLYERITGEQFQPPSLDEPVQQRMAKNLASYL